jgi:hypothetical protein
MLRARRTLGQLTLRTAPALLVAGLLAAVAPAAVAAEAPPAAAFVDLGSASTFSVLAGAGVSNTGTATVLALDLGLSPAGAIAGFPPGKANGATHDKDAVAATAQEDRQAAYEAVLAQPSTTSFAGDQAGVTFKPGVHTSAAAVTNTGTITLDADGDPGAVFVFQVGAAFSTAAATKVVLSDGALANNVFWQVTGAVSVGAGAKLVGTLLAAGVVTFGEASSLKGRILTPGTVALASTPVTQPKDDLTAPLVTILGGATRSTNDASPMISGTTDEAAGRTVTVTVDGQDLATTVGVGGSWQVSATDLAAGDHTVLATVADGSRNVGSATQVLTVDLTAPSLSLDGGSRWATKDTTPTVSGTTDATGAVTVKVDGQILSAPVTDGVWSVDVAVLSEDAHVVSAYVVDDSANTSTASQVVVVDLTAPVVTIDGGASRSTTDRSPWTYGTSGERAGTTVRVSVGGQDLAAIVLSDGVWSVSATDLVAGSYALVATVADAAGNSSSAFQTLTIGGAGPGPVPPTLAPPASYRPDAAIRGASGAFVGAGSYAAVQRVSQLVRTRRSASFQVRLTNRGSAAERLAVRGARRSARFAVAYLVGGRNVTAAVVAGSYRTAVVAPGRSLVLVVRVTRTAAARRGDTRVFTVRAGSTHVTSRADTVGAVVRR